MVLNSRAKDFVLITAEEYSALSSLRKSESAERAATDLKENENTSISELANKGKVSLQFPSASECAQWNLHSRYKKRPQPATTLSDFKKTEAASQSSKSENVIIEFSSVGLSGGKVERSRQILRKINDTENVSIDKSSGRILLHDRDTGVSVFDFLYYLQTTTKNLNEPTLDLVRRLQLPEYF